MLKTGTFALDALTLRTNMPALFSVNLTAGFASNCWLVEECWRLVV